MRSAPSTIVPLLTTLLIATWVASGGGSEPQATDRSIDEPNATEASTEHAPGFLARVQQHIAEREYWASPNAEGLQAPNRQHGLRTYFEPDGIREDVSSAEGAWVVPARVIFPPPSHPPHSHEAHRRPVHRRRGLAALRDLP